MARRHANYGLARESEARVQQEFDDVDSRKQDVAHKVLSRAPVAREVPANGFILALVSGTLRVYTKVQGSLYYIDWTKV